MDIDGWPPTLRLAGATNVRQHDSEKPRTTRRTVPTLHQSTSRSGVWSLFAHTTITPRDAFAVIGRSQFGLLHFEHTWGRSARRGSDACARRCPPSSMTIPSRLYSISHRVEDDSATSLAGVVNVTDLQDGSAPEAASRRPERGKLRGSDAVNSPKAIAGACLRGATPSMPRAVRIARRALSPRGGGFSTR